MERELEKYIASYLPYRMKAVGQLSLAFDWWVEWDQPKKMEIYLDDELKVTGNSNAFVNPILDAGFLHARALLEFLGLKEKDGSLKLLGSRRTDDIGIENFNLPKLTPEQAINSYNGESEFAEKSLVSIFNIVNKGYAHTTASLSNHWSSEHIRAAALGIPVLVANHLYVPLGLEVPEFQPRFNNDR